MNGQRGSGGGVSVFEPLYQAVLTGNKEQAAELTRQALEDGAEAQALVDGSLVPAMAEVGRLFEDNEFFVPELLISARAMKAALELIRPLLANTGAARKGTVVLGTVEGDLHDIGKNLVSAMLEGAGFDVVDLGTDVAPEAFVEAAVTRNADLIGLSALLTLTMPSMKSTIETLDAAVHVALHFLDQH